MQKPKILRIEAISIEDLWSELVHSEAKLLYDESGADLAKDVSALANRAEQVRVEQLKAWRKETIAQANVEARNRSLDALTREFEKQLYRHLEDSGIKEPTRDARYKAYFPEALSRTLNLGLEAQVQKTRHFVTALQKESSPLLQSFESKFSQEFTFADAALKSLSDAQVERRKHRAEQISTLFDEANTTRQSIFGKLTTRAAEQRLEREWPNGFFRQTVSATEDPKDLKRSSILLTLTARNIDLSKENKQRINNEENEATLLLWLSRAGTIVEQAELFS